jgi:gamma-tubulin complex component 5
MAQVTKVNAILGELVISFAKAAGDNNPRKLKSTKESVSKLAKQHQYTRTNPFEVYSTLEGLIEKFSVIARDDLADALQKRLNELNARPSGKWTPEVLSLFLSLSERPERAAGLEALELLKPEVVNEEKTFTWEDLEREEPMTGELWKDESYESGSEDESEVVQVGKPQENETSPPTVASQDDDISPCITDTISTSVYTDVGASQFWTQADLRSSKPQLLSELQIIREVLLMLRGLPTSIFAIDEKNVLIYHATNVMLSQISLSGLNDVLQSFASMGSDLLRLRFWTGQPQQVPLLQAFNSAVCKCLWDFDRSIAVIEEAFVQPQQKPILVSILRAHNEIEALSRPFAALSSLTTSLSYSGSFLILELLYDQLCTLQAAGDSECFSMLGDIFFTSLNMYLRPVSLWMEQGVILENEESFFIAIADKGSKLEALWHERYTLRLTNDGTVHAPAFLRPATKKILNAGKSVVFLQHLRKDVPAPRVNQPTRLDFTSVLEADGELPLLPFSELFKSAFDTWMSSKYSSASSILKHHLLHNSGLLIHIDALSHIYFSTNGVLFQTFADDLFKRMSNRRSQWADKFLLTELARRTFGGVEGAKAGSLSVRITSTKDVSGRTLKALSGLVLDVNLPWPVQNVIPRTSLATYQRIFTFLLRIRHATVHLLPRPTHGQAKHLAIGIRQHLLWFTNTLHSYVLETVVHPAVERLKEELVQAEDLDEMCKVHEEFVKRLERKCLLARELEVIWDSVLGVLDLAVVFAEIQNPSTHNKAKLRSQLTSTSTRGRRKHRTDEDLDEDDAASNTSESENESEHESPSTPATEEAPDKRLQTIHDQFSQLLHFTVAGLRGVSRAGGQVEWEMLSERLDWGIQKRTKEYI